MTTCTVCGARLESTSLGCTVCGAPLGAPQRGGSAAASGPGTATPGAAGVPGPPAGPGGGGYGPPATPGAAGVPGPPAGPGGGGYGPPGWAPPGSGPPRPHPSGLSSELRGWGIGAHLSGLVLGLASAAMLAFLGPLIVWMLKRADHPFVDHHAKEALNFQITALIVIAASALLAVPVVIVGVLTVGLALIPIAFLALAAVIAWFALPIVAAIKAADGEGYRYPFTIRVVQ